MELAEKVCVACDKASSFAPIYDIDLSIEEKLDAIATKIYGAKSGSVHRPGAKGAGGNQKARGDRLPVCVAKTQYSLSDNPNLLGRPEDFVITVRDLRLSNGAGFVVALTGDIMTMPGLPKVPAGGED